MSETHKSKEILNAVLGKRFGKLIAVEFTGKSTNTKYKRRIIRCKCDCGNEKLITLTNLNRGTTNSCGCMALDSSNVNIKIAHEYNIKKFSKLDPKISSARKVWRDLYSDEDISFDEFLQLSQQNCFYCDKIPSNNYNSANGPKYSKYRKENGLFTYNGLDRVNNGLGHFKNNVVPCCYYCNIAKLDRTKEDFFEWIKLVYNKHCKE